MAGVPLPGPDSEPVLNTATIVAIIGSALGLAATFGFSLDKEQTVALLGFLTLVLPFVTGYIARRKVSPVESVAVQVDEDGALVAGDGLSDVPTGTPVAVVDSTTP